MLKLLCISGLNQGKEYSLTKEKTILGRMIESDICVLDTESSRSHCTISFCSDEFSVQDNTSKNGTYVNNLRIKGSIALADGDALKVGNTTYMVFTEKSSENLEHLTTTLRRSPQYSEDVLHSKSLEMSNTITIPKNYK